MGSSLFNKGMLIIGLAVLMTCAYLIGGSVLRGDSLFVWGPALAFALTFGLQWASVLLNRMDIAGNAEVYRVAPATPKLRLALSPRLIGLIVIVPVLLVGSYLVSSEAFASESVNDMGSVLIATLGSWLVACGFQMGLLAERLPVKSVAARHYQLCLEQRFLFGGLLAVCVAALIRLVTLQ